VASASLRLLYSLLYSAHQLHSSFRFPSFPYSSCVFFPYVWPMSNMFFSMSDSIIAFVLCL
jgi:hypothetical protein